MKLVEELRIYSNLKKNEDEANIKRKKISPMDIVNDLLRERARRGYADAILISYAGRYFPCVPSASEIADYLNSEGLQTFVSYPDEDKVYVKWDEE